ncbi:MOSC domain-containing protein [Sphingomonas yabuuchiae]|uniref:MOSC domain-containing protein n=2 Tax=Sphingomonas TaxID=13687 RepID=A0AA41DAL9_9SPHN|nr:molybdenum cofactor biosysynthesis protein [Sphingomonas sp. LK11]MBB4610075.1 MOSC domain-containing protein YiiM [Sphingomonas yabuuchiae]MBN3557848.1 MOSC domain-containing protein [Sphingomonas yabuuchiae]
MTGRLAGIARHAVPKGPMEVIDTAIVTLEGGVEGDVRGRIKPGGRGRRQVTLIERADWDAALAEIGRDIPWQERRANLLVEDFDLPQIPGTRLRIGTVLLQITMECDPCHRMDAIADGLQAALTPDWRGGVCTRVIEGGTIRIGDNIRIEES